MTDGIDGQHGESYKGKDWIETYCGRQFFPMRPSEGSFCLVDMAHALALKCRYNGHTRKFYSVAEHTLIMEDHANRVLHLDARTRLEIITHDCSETYFPDISRPLKQFCLDLVAQEKKVGRMIRSWFGLYGDMPEAVHNLDARIIKDERRDVMSKSANVWTTDALDALDERISGLDWQTAEQLWLCRAADLYREVHGVQVLWLEGQESYGGTVVTTVDNGRYDWLAVDALGEVGLNDRGQWINGLFSIHPRHA